MPLPSSASLLASAFALTSLRAALVASLGCALLVGCGGSGDGQGLFKGADPDAGASNQNPPGSLFGDAGGAADGSEPACPPAKLTSFTPEWKAPNASASGACTTAQISTFYDACLGPASSPAGCTAFGQASEGNGTCAQCLQTSDSAAQFGPVIWHDNQLFYTTNIAGCIADKQKDTSATGCGAAYQAVVTCKQTACASCLSAANPDYSRYATCENQAGSECDAFIQTLNTTCGTALKDPKNVIAVCLPPSNDTAQDAYLRLAPIFCGQ